MTSASVQLQLAHVSYWILLLIPAAVGVSNTSSLEPGKVSLVVKSLRETENPALPLILDAVDAARAAGVDDSTLEVHRDAARIRAGADLSLLGEVTAVAGNALAGLSLDLRQALATATIDAGKINEAYSLAERAGVPAEELSAAKAVLHAEVHARLAASKASLEMNVSETTMRDLAANIDAGQNLQLDDVELDDARTALLAAFQSIAAAGDVDLAEQVVALADVAHVPLPQPLTEWPGAVQFVRAAASLPGDRDEDFAQLLLALRKASMANLPRSVALDAVEHMARTAAELRLAPLLANDSMAEERPTTHWLEATDVAEEVGVANDTLGKARTTLRDRAEAELQLAVASDLSDANRVKEAFSLAEILGLPLDVRFAAQTALQNILSQRISEAQDALAGNCTVQTIEMLAAAMAAGYDLGANETDLEGARKVFEACLEPDVVSADLQVLVQGVALADSARAKLPKNVTDKASAAVLIFNAMALSDDDPQGLPQLLHALQFSRDAGLSDAGEVVAVEAIARTCASVKLNATIVDSFDLEAILAALETAQEVGVPAETMETAVSIVHAHLEQTLTEALSAGLPSGVDQVAGALIAADRCNFNASSARADLNAQLQARLEQLKLALEINRTTQAAQDLAFVLDAARRLDFDGNETQAARLAFHEQLLQAEIDGDVEFARGVSEFADQASVKVPAKLQAWSSAAKQVQELASLPELSNTDFSRALQVLADTQEKGFPRTQDLVALEAKTKAQAIANLDDVVNGTSAATIELAIRTAVDIGVSEADLLAARAVLAYRG